MKRMNRCVLALWALAGFVLSSCESRQHDSGQISTVDEASKDDMQRVGIFSFPGDYETDQPEDIVAYFDSLCRQGVCVAVHGNEREDSLQVWDAVRLLNRSAQLEGKSFPMVSLRKAMESLAREQAYLYSHGSPEGGNGGEAFLFRLIEQAALHCYQTSFLTDFHTDDGRAGVINFSDWSGMNPLYSFLVYKTGTRCRVKMIGDKGDTMIEEISHLTDGKGGDYYLCSNNNEGVYFRQYLYRWNGDDMLLVCDH